MADREDFSVTKLRVEQALVGSGSYESLITTKSLDAEDGGKTFGLNLAAGFTVTLPDISKVPTGWKVRFRVEIAPTTAYIITENAATETNKVIGSINTSTAQTAAASFHATGATFVNFVANEAVLGDWATVESNGTNWFAYGQCTVVAGIVIA